MDVIKPQDAYISFVYRQMVNGDQTEFITVTTLGAFQQLPRIGDGIEVREPAFKKAISGYVTKVSHVTEIKGRGTEAESLGQSIYIDVI